MLTLFPRARLESIGHHEISEELERGRIACFPECPLELPGADDLAFLRDEMPKHLRLKNISYHPEAGRILGIRGNPEIVERAQRLLSDHGARVQAFLSKVAPGMVKDWQVGTTSFRPIQEQGRNLSSHASNERLHVDAGAYGATHGDRVVRFFVNVNPTEDRIWISKGNFSKLYQDLGASAGVLRPNGTAGHLEEGWLDRFRTRAVGLLAKAVPPARLLDSSPYDRAMRRMHNYMKESEEYQTRAEGRIEIRFKPFWAWMVFTDMVTHACTSGQHAFVSTFIVPLRNCRLPDLAPINILRGR